MSQVALLIQDGRSTVEQDAQRPVRCSCLFWQICLRVLLTEGSEIQGCRKQGEFESVILPVCVRGESLSAVHRVVWRFVLRGN